MKAFCRCSLFLFFLMVGCARETLKDTQAEDWAYLKKWIGKYPVPVQEEKAEYIAELGTSNFFELPMIKARLAKLLPEEDYERLTKTYAVSSPIRQVDNYLIIERCMPHCCPCENVLFLIGLQNKYMLLFFRNNEDRLARCFSNQPKGFDALPNSIKERIRYLLYGSPTNCFEPKELVVIFPGADSSVRSPDGRYILINVDSKDDEDAQLLEGNHALYLRDLHSGEEKRIYSYDRWVRIIWSPKGKGLMITDHGGSDYSTVVIFSIGSEKKPIDLEEELKKQIGDNLTIFGNHHVYVEGTKWLSEDEILVKIRGYGEVDPNGFTLWYDYRVGDQFRFVKRSPLDED